MIPRTRVEFVAVDVNNDGDYTDEDEGFIRVYRGGDNSASVLNFVTARLWNPASANDPNLVSPNCGDQPAGQQFLAAVNHGAAGPAGHNHGGTAATNQRASLNQPTRRCYLGGDPRLTNGFVAGTAFGSWVRWPGYGAGSAPAALQNKNVHPQNGGGTTGGAGGLADYLWPINRPFNPNFKGVIYVDGSVAVSGVVRKSGYPGHYRKHPAG